MKQNLDEFVSLIDEAHLSRQQLWNKYMSVLQRRRQSRVRAQRNFRCSRALFEKQVSVLDRRFDPDGEHSVVAGDGPLALCRPDRASKVAKRILRRVPCPLRGVEAAGLDEDSTSARDYLDAALPLFAYVSVPAKSGSGLPSSGEVGQAHPREDHRHETQAQDVLVFATAGAAGQVPDELSVFPVADAGHADVLDYINMDSAWREQTHVWSSSDPDAEGATLLTSLSRQGPAVCAGRLVRADLGAARRFAFRGISPSSASDLSKSREGLDSLM